MRPPVPQSSTNFGIPPTAAYRTRRLVDELDGSPILPPLDRPLDSILLPWRTGENGSDGSTRYFRPNNDPLSRRLLPSSGALSLRRPRTVREASRKSFDHLGITAAPVRVEICACDGGSLDFDDSGRYNCENMLYDNSAVYCTAKLENVNILLKSAGSRAFTLTRMVIKAPQRSFTSPVKDGLVFVSMDRIENQDTAPYDRPDSISEATFSLSEPETDLQRLLDGQELAQSTTHLEDLAVDHSIVRPHAYFLIDERTGHATIDFEPAISGRYVHIKLLSGQSFDSYSGRFERDNIDLQAVLLYGYGRRVFPKYEFR